MFAHSLAPRFQPLPLPDPGVPAAPVTPTDWRRAVAAERARAGQPGGVQRFRLPPYLTPTTDARNPLALARRTVVSETRWRGMTDEGRARHLAALTEILSPWFFGYRAKTQLCFAQSPERSRRFPEGRVVVAATPDALLSQVARLVPALSPIPEP